MILVLFALTTSAVILRHECFLQIEKCRQLAETINFLKALLSKAIKFLCRFYGNTNIQVEMLFSTNFYLNGCVLTLISFTTVEDFNLIQDTWYKFGKNWYIINFAKDLLTSAAFPLQIQLTKKARKFCLRYFIFYALKWFDLSEKIKYFMLYLLNIFFKMLQFR